MFQRDRSDSSDAPERRAKRGLGPFTGTQLTIVIVAVVMAVGFPVGAWAVTGSNVFVTDSVSGKTAAVNASRQLSTTAAVTGTVTATPPASGSQFSVELATFDDSTIPATLCGAFTPPGGKAAVITSVTLTAPATSGFGGKISFPLDVELKSIDDPAPATCTSGTGTGVNLPQSFAGVGSASVAIPTGLTIKNGHSITLRLSALSTAAADGVALAVVNGYYVASTACTASTCY